MPFAHTIPALLALLLAGCDGDTGSTDADGDGWTVHDGDCDDRDPAVHPGMVDVPVNGIDQDCDGGDTCYLDADQDGWGSAETVASPGFSCQDPGESTASTDCDDGDPEVHPGATEVVADELDQDCDDGEICYQDGDGDGFGSEERVASADVDCRDAGESTVSTDCDDVAHDVSPDAGEVCGNGADDDCDGVADCCDPSCVGDVACQEACTGGTDEDCDGLVDCEDGDCAGPACGEDCDDGFDNDGDGLVDCEDGDCADAHGCHEYCYGPYDVDGDGLVACEDDDCWAEPFCRVMSIRVKGGRAEGRAVSSQRSFRFSSTMWTDWDSIEREERDLRLWSVTGTAQVRVPGTYGIRTCTWSVPYATVHVEYAYGFEWHGPPDFDPGAFVPASFHGQPGCSFGTGYLPMALDVVRGHGARHVYSWSAYVWRHEDSWIDGAAVEDGRSTVHLDYPSEHWGLFRADIETRSWHISTLTTGVPYTAWMWW